MLPAAMVNFTFMKRLPTAREARARWLIPPGTSVLGRGRRMGATSSTSTKARVSPPIIRSGYFLSLESASRFHFLRAPSTNSNRNFLPTGSGSLTPPANRERMKSLSCPFPGRTWQLSGGGGSEPRWRRDGKELFHLAPGGKMMVVEIREKGSSLDIAVPQQLY